MKKMSAVKAMLVASVAVGTMPMAARAQSIPAAEEEAAPAEEMVVVGQRQQYRGDVPLSAVPQTVQVLDAKTLQDLNITRLEGALELASGIAKQNNFGGLWDAFAVRGFAGDENFPSGFLVNGFNGGRGYGGPRDASNIEKIEILKGPNGAVFGRGEPGGTVNITTKKARTDDTFGSFAASGGSWNTYRGEADVNIAVSDQLAIRVNGAAEDGDSFRDVVNHTKFVASPSILYKPSNNTSLSYEMEFVDNKVTFDRGIVAINGKLGAVPISRFLGEPGDGRTNVKVLGHQVQLQQKISKDWFFLAGFGYRDTSFKGFSQDPELALGRQIIDNDGQNLSRQRRFRDFNTTNTTVRGEISGKLYTGPLTHHILVGADYDRFHIDLLQIRYRPPSYTAGSPITAANNAINVFNPVYGNLRTPTQTNINSDEVQKAWGIYFQDQVDVTDQLKVRFGGRFDHFNQYIVNRNLATNNVTDATKKRFNPTAGVLYKVTDTVSIYGGYGEGFRPNSGLDFNGNPFAPELSKSFEAGLRFAAPGDAISATLAAFTMKKNNILTSDPVNAGFSVAGGEAKSKGIEADVSANLPGDITILATYAYTDAYWSKAGKDFNFALPILPGDRLINIPKHAANLLVNKGFMIAGRRATFGGGLNYVGKRLGETATTFELPGYVIARVMASFEPMDNLKLTADVSNLFDKTYYASSYSQLWVAPGAPRAFTIKAAYSF